MSHASGRKAKRKELIREAKKADDSTDRQDKGALSVNDQMDSDDEPLGLNGIM